MNDFLPDETIPASGLNLTLPPVVAEASRPGDVVEGALGLSQAAKQVVSAGRFSLCLFSQELDAHVYGTPAFVEAVKLMVLSQRRAQVRILLASARAAGRGPHALVELARIVSSRIEVRELAPHRPTEVSEMVISDGRVLVERRNLKDLQAYLFTQAPHLARERQRHFDTLWEEARPSNELRRLSI